MYVLKKKKGTKKCPFQLSQYSLMLSVSDNFIFKINITRAHLKKGLMFCYSRFIYKISSQVSFYKIQ